MKYNYLTVFMLLILAHAGFAQSKMRESLGTQGKSDIVKINSDIYFFQQSIGQASPTGRYQLEGNEIRQGFIQPLSPTVFGDLLEEGSSRVFVYPNPFSSYVRFKFDKDRLLEARVEVYDMAGKMLKVITYDTDASAILDLSRFSAGNYLVVTKVGRTRFTNMIIKN